MKLKADMASEGDHCGHGLRPITVELSLLSRPDGSAQICHGDTSVMAAVYGPGEIKISKERLDRATTEVVYKPKVGFPGCSDRAQEQLICRVCESMILSGMHPRTAITIVVQEMQNSGGFLAACINAACMALLDAAVPLQHTVAAVSCCVLDEGQIQMDPTAKDEEGAAASMTFVFDSKSAGVVLASCTGNYTHEQYQKSMVACKQASDRLFVSQRDAMTRKLTKTV